MYFKLTRLGVEHPARRIRTWPNAVASSFRRGARITAPLPLPLEFTLTDARIDAQEGGVTMPAMFSVGILLLRDDLLAAMVAAGADNLDAYEVIVREPDGSRAYTNYKAVNVVGLVAAADLARSKATVHPGGPIIDVEFDELVLDPSRPRGALIFRLAEATASIFVHDRLRKHLLASGFDELAFLEPGDAFV